MLTKDTHIASTEGGYTDGAPLIIVAEELKKCCGSWDPKARLLGNIRAEDIFKVCDAFIKSETALKELCTTALNNYPDKVNDYKLGKTALLGLFTGEVMKNSHNLANPEATIKMLTELLK